MNSTLDLNLMLIARLAGEEHPEMPDLYTAKPPRRAARGRETDSLIIYLSLLGNAPLTPEAQTRLLEGLAQQFYKTTGSLTAAMRSIAETLNLQLLDRNLRSTGGGRQTIGQLTLAALRGDTLYIAQSGAVQAYLVTNTETKLMYDLQTSGRGLGLSQSTPVRFLQLKMAPGDYLVLSTIPASAWSEAILQYPAQQGMDALRHQLVMKAGPEYNAVIVQAQAGTGKLNLIKHKPGATAMAAPLPESPIPAAAPVAIPTQPVSTVPAVTASLPERPAISQIESSSASTEHHGTVEVQVASTETAQSAPAPADNAGAVTASATPDASLGTTIPQPVDQKTKDVTPSVAATASALADIANPNSGPAKGADASGPAKGADASGPAKGAIASTPAKGAEASGPVNSVDQTAQSNRPTMMAAAAAASAIPQPGKPQTQPVPSAQPSSSAVQLAKGADASGPAKGANASGSARGADASGPAKGANASGPAEGADASGPAKGADASGPAKSATAPKPIPGSKQLASIGRVLGPVVAAILRALRNTLGAIGNALLRLLKNLLPDADVLHLPASTMVFIAIAIPLVLAVLGGMVFLQRGQAQQYQVFYQQAEEKAAYAASLTNPLEQRLALQTALGVLDKAEAYTVTSQSQALRAKLTVTLDELDAVKRLDYKQAIVNGLETGVKVTRIVASAADLYLLDGNAGSVLHAVMTSRGYEIDPTFKCGPTQGDITVGPLVDIVELPPGSIENASILGIDASGNLLYCVVGGQPLSNKLMPPNTGLGSPTGMSLDRGDLYVLDPSVNAVWIYFSMKVVEQPTLFFGDEVPPMQDVIDLEVYNDELYMLHADGHTTKCTYSAMAESPTRCDDPVPYSDNRPGRSHGPVIEDAVFSQMDYITFPERSIFYLDPQHQAIYYFSVLLTLQYQFQPKTPLAKGEATAFSISANRIAFLAVGNNVYYAAMP